MVKRLKITYRNGDEKLFKSINDVHKNLLILNGEKRKWRTIKKTEIITV